MNYTGRYRALLADNRQSLQGDVPDHEPIPDPNESEEAFLKYLAYVFDYLSFITILDTLYIIVMVVSYVMLTTTLSSAHVAHLDSSTRFTKRLVVHLELLRICDSFLRKLSASSSLCNTNMSFFCMNSACKFRFDLVFHPFEPSEIARKTDRGLIAVSTCSTHASSKKNSLCFSSNPL